MKWDILHNECFYFWCFKYIFDANAFVLLLKYIVNSGLLLVQLVFVLPVATWPCLLLWQRGDRVGRGRTLCESARKLGSLVWEAGAVLGQRVCHWELLSTWPGRSWWSMDEESHRRVQLKDLHCEKEQKKVQLLAKHLLSLTFQIGLRLKHSSMPTDLSPLSPQYCVLTVTHIITLALSLKKSSSFAPTA